MIISLTCTYCNYQWSRYVPKKSEMEQPSCLKCGDESIRMRDLEATKIDYYAGAPAFPASPLTKDLLDYLLVGSEY